MAEILYKVALNTINKPQLRYVITLPYAIVFRLPFLVMLIINEYNILSGL